MMVHIPDELYLHSIGKNISTANMGRIGGIVTCALTVALDMRFRKCKTEGAKMRLFETLEQGKWCAKRATFAEKLNETEAETLVDMLTTEQKQAIIGALMKRGY